MAATSSYLSCGTCIRIVLVPSASQTVLSLEADLPHFTQICFRPAILSLENQVSQLPTNTRYKQGQKNHVIQFQCCNI